MEKIQKIVSFIVEEKEKKKKTIRVIASDETIDRDGDIIRAKGWKIENYLKNPVILPVHNWKGEPVGKAEKVYVEEDKLIIEGIDFAPTEEGQKWKSLVEGGYVKTVSVGFMPLRVFYPQAEEDVKTIKELDEEWFTKNEEKIKNARRIIWEAELFEVSFVPIPANPNALIEFVNKGLDIAYSFDINGQLIEIDLTPYAEYKGVVPYSAHPKNMKVKKTSSWDRNKAVRTLLKWASSDCSGDWEKVNKRKFRTGFGYVDEKNADKVSGYKYPHHQADCEGNFYVDTRGVEVAMAFCLARKGNLSESEFKQLYNHLAKHYTNDLKKDPPEWKDTPYDFSDLRKIFDIEVLKEYIKEYPEDVLREIFILERAIDNLNKEIEKLKNNSPSPPSDKEGVDNEGDNDIKIEVSEEEIKEAISVAISTFLKNFKGGK